MRRFKRTSIVAALALGAFLALPAMSSASHPGHVFQADVSLLGKAKGGKPAPAAVHILLQGADDPATPNDPAPPKAQVIRILIDKAVNVSFKGLTICNANLEGTTVAQAQAACGKSQVGTGTVTALIGNAPVTGSLLAFIGPNGTLTLHITVDAGGTPVTQIIPARFLQASDQSLYGQEVEITVPTLAGGAGSLTSADITLSKQVTKKKGKSVDAEASKKKKKKKYSLFTAQCTDGVYNFLNIETYSDHETITEPFTQTCTK
jgi:hypothetical protein